MNKSKSKELPDVPAFHIMFPLTLTYLDDKKFEKNCYFQCREHVDKYIERYKIKRPKIRKTKKR